MTFGPISPPIISAISMAPSGIMMPSDQQSKKSSQQSFQPSTFFTLKSAAGAMPFSPRPSAATSAAMAVMTAEMIRTTFLRLSALPFSAALSMKWAASTSIREMAEEMAAIRTSR